MRFSWIPNFMLTMKTITLCLCGSGAVLSADIHLLELLVATGWCHCLDFAGALGWTGIGSADILANFQMHAPDQKSPLSFHWKEKKRILISNYWKKKSKYENKIKYPTNKKKSKYVTLHHRDRFWIKTQQPLSGHHLKYSVSQMSLSSWRYHGSATRYKHTGQ